eukprot:TRINITY_DN159_c0_g1_i1.p1 TRINITY_DN159_c0_g1~~TRINITY_DN159_c0_g1_i1.p1  ORF type:complete len:430 (+),score=130.21 TRINITY_DN159_c0_g1_i1:334-1623(+)
MGQTLSEPITKKHSSSAKNDFLKVGSSSMQGWRINMEDSHTHILELKDDPDAAYFGVYDGHGGAKIADHISKNLHKYVSRHYEYISGNIQNGIRKGFLQCDKDMRKDSDLTDETSGSTAITALLRNNNKLYVANVGDSRCVGFREEETVALSFDHKPNNPKEQKRIEGAGGFVDFNRVNGNLALSRAFGDFEFKKNDDLPPEKQVVTCFPDIVEKDIDESWNFIVLACDGIWDVLSNEEVVKFVAARIALNHQPEIICEKLMNRCLSEDSGMNGFGCDNMTVIIVCFLHNQPYSRLVERCANYMAKLRERSLLVIEEDDWSNSPVEKVKTWQYDSDEVLEYDGEDLRDDSSTNPTSDDEDESSSDDDDKPSSNDEEDESSSDDEEDKPSPSDETKETPSEDKTHEKEKVVEEAEESIKDLSLKSKEPQT